MATTVYPKQNGRVCKIERYFLTRRYVPPTDTWPLDGPFAYDALTAPEAPQWARDLVDVLIGDSDRALRHRMIEYSITYRRHGDEDPPVLNADLDEDGQPSLHEAYDFLPPRKIEQEDCEGVVRIHFAIADVSTIPQDRRECPICRDTYDWDVDILLSSPFPLNPEDRACPAVALRCGHYMCRNCLLGHMSHNGPDVECPLCRRDILGELAKDQLRFNEYYDPHGDPNNPHDQYIYYESLLWTREENIQRSMSDLDRRLATHPAVKDYFIPTYNPHMLFDLWLDIVKMDDTFPDGTAHRCTFAPEWRTVVSHTARAISQLDPDGILSGAMFEQLQNSVTAALRVDMGPRQTLYNDQLRNTPATNLHAARKMRVWPSGIEAFWSRNMSRLINYVRLRACDCKVEGEYSQWRTVENEWHADREPGDMSWQDVMDKWAKHYHGDREHYSPQVSLFKARDGTMLTRLQVYDKMMLRDGETWRN